MRLCFAFSILFVLCGRPSCLGAVEKIVEDDPANDIAVTNSSHASILGGRPAPVGRYPYIAKSFPFNCGGTLIYEDIVLSAGHCRGVFVDGLHIGGVLADGSDGKFFRVDRECLHPDFSSAQAYDVNDLLLVKLSRPSEAPLVELNLDYTSIPARFDVLTTIGWGDTLVDGFLSPILLQVKIDTYSDTACVNEYDVYVPETMICAGTVKGGKDSCQGDSGGPLFTSDLLQVGITSYGNSCGLPNVPAAYTEVAAFATYIRQGICALSDSPPSTCEDADVAQFTCKGGMESDDTIVTDDDIPDIDDDITGIDDDITGIDDDILGIDDDILGIDDDIPEIDDVVITDDRITSVTEPTREPRATPTKPPTAKPKAPQTERPSIKPVEAPIVSSVGGKMGMKKQGGMKLRLLQKRWKHIVN